MYARVRLFEEGILLGWMRGLVAPPLGGGEGGRAGLCLTTRHHWGVGVGGMSPPPPLEPTPPPL